jgi:uncharacterized membrane protein YeiH
LLDIRPFFWVANAYWLWALFALCFLAMWLMRGKELASAQRIIVVPDAVGLGIFGAVGTITAYHLNLPGLVCVFMGVITAVFGGVLRDVVCNDIPQAFSDHQPYAVLAFAGSWVLLGLLFLGTPEWLALLASAALVTGLRLLAVRLNWQLPPWRM